ncbi:MAG: glycosyltransferase family 2 protein [Polymorphobacter sp.]
MTSPAPEPCASLLRAAPAATCADGRGPAAVLVTVIVPAHNAAQTIAGTLASALAQTHAALEILVIDDGSTDTTAQIVADMARTEPRLRLIRQANGGVAKARNAGLRQARGCYVAWLDADDLWHATKIEKQLARFAQSPVPLTFVYTGYRLIDPDDRIIANHRTLVDVSGDTVCRQIATNHFSNVSSIMVPTALARCMGGHEPELLALGIGGAEDLLLQLKLALLGPAGCVSEALVGYRIHSHNMSLDVARSARSNLMALALVQARAPDVPDWVFALGRARTAGYVLHMLRRGQFGAAAAHLARLLLGQPALTLLVLGQSLAWAARDALGWRPADPQLGTRFAYADPATVPWEGHMLLGGRHRRALDRADAARVSDATAGNADLFAPAAAAPEAAAA